MSANDEPVDDDDIYDVMPATEKTVSDINKLKNMFEQKPMGVYSPGKPPPNNKIFTGGGGGENRPTPAEKPAVKFKPCGGKAIIPGNLNSELQKNKQFSHSGPQLPGKSNRTSVVNGEVVKGNGSEGAAPPPLIPKKTGKQGPPVAAKTHPKPAPPKSSPPPATASKPLSSPPAPGGKAKPTPPVRKDSNDNHVSPASPTATTPPGGSSPRSPATTGSNDKAVEKEDNNIEYLSDPIEGPNGAKYRMVKCHKATGAPPAKPGLPTRVDIHDILQQYADDDDMYDDVVTEDSAAARPVSVIPEFTEDEEKELARQAKTTPPDPEQELYTDTRPEATRAERTLSQMSTGSDVYESFDEVEGGADVKL